MAVSDPPTPAPDLRPPGAGLPWWELLVARHVVFPRACRRLDWAAAARLFQAEGVKVLAGFDAVPADRQSERVLVRRLRGIEDSSRHWSAAMTVEHLNIVGASIRGILAALRRNDQPGRAARIADVKPRGELPPAEVRTTFVRLLADTAAEEAAQPPLLPGAGPRFAHPWFGPIDAHRWHCLLGIHQGIHRKQLDAIRAGLGPNR